MLKMAVLLSGSGRTLDNFHERIEAGTLNGEVQVVISNVADALGLEKAKNYGYPAFHAVGNEATNEILKDYDIDIICLAGYLKLYSPPKDLARRVINIHPALLPSFGGDGFYGNRVHSAVKARGCTISGCTVHFANENYDEGPIICQMSGILVLMIPSAKSVPRFLMWNVKPFQKQSTWLMRKELIFSGIGLANEQ